MGDCSLITTTVAILLFLCNQLHCSAIADHHHVRVVPDLSKECENSLQCFTFSDSLQRAEEVFMSHTIVEFSAGEYSIPWDSISDDLTVSGITDILLTGPQSPYDQVHITCHSRFHLQFIQCSNITIASIHFTGCGSWSDLGSGTLLFTNVCSLMVTKVTVRDSYGYGLLATNLSGDVIISNCMFSNNSRREGYGGQFKKGGNCHLHLQVYQTTIPTSLEVLESLFQYGIAEGVLEYDTEPMKQVSGGGGLAIYFMESHYIVKLNPVIIRLDNCTFVNNSAQSGGNLLLHISNKSKYRSSYFDIIARVSLNRCTFHGGTAYAFGGGLHASLDIQREHTAPKTVTKVQTVISASTFTNNMAQNGGGLSLDMGDTWLEDTTALILSELSLRENIAEAGGGLYAQCTHCLDCVRVEHSLFLQNYAMSGGALYLFAKFLTKEPLDGIRQADIGLIVDFLILKVHATNFTRNKGESGSAIRIQGYGSYFQPELCPFPTIASVWLESVQILASSLYEDIMYYGAAAVHVESVQWIALEDTTFLHNVGGGVYANNSNVVLVGNVSFEDNYGFYGGAIQLDCQCESRSFQPFLYVTSYSHTSIVNNTALEFGGGISVSEWCSDPKICFFQGMHNSNWNTKVINATVVMRDNHAGIAGDHIYGVSEPDCHLLGTNMGSLLKLFFQLLSETETLSSTSSIPYRVCLCNSDSPKTYCLNRTDNVSAAAVGNHRGASPAVVQSQLIAEKNAEVGTRQKAQNLGRTCGNLTFSIKTSASNVQLHLTLERITQTGITRMLPSRVFVAIIPCPLGFMEVGIPPECECLPHLSKAGVVCDINTQTHRCPTGMWIGNFSGGIVTHPPVHLTTVNLEYPL